jgi:hypothetical protein
MDIDIDFPDRDIILSKLQHRIALLESGKKHNTGIYATEIPHNPVTNISTIPHKQAEERGYFKLDFLNVSIYQNVRDEEHLVQLMTTEPIWNLLQEEQFVDQLFHLNGHCDLLKKVRPTSVEQLAAVLAMIRPSKRHLQDEDWTTIMSEVWKKPIDGAYYYKQAHAVSYAMAVVVHMNLLCEEILESN